MEEKHGEIRQLQIKERLQMDTQTPQATWREKVRRKPGEEALKNMAVAAALVVCAAVLRSGAIPQLDNTTDVIMTAVTGDTLLDEQLGKLSFVSSMFPEATLVFGEQTADSTLAMPVSAGTIVHAWSEKEPYLSWQTGSREVRASAAGEVTAVVHGNGEERIIQVMSGDDLVCLYGNLAECSVTTGDSVEAGDVLGQLIQGADCVLEVRKDGYSLDPLKLMDGAL